MFNQYVAMGERLRKLHLLQCELSYNLSLNPSLPNNLVIESIKYKNGVLRINNETEIATIPQNVWDYQIGGYNIIDKWFKEHKGESLTIESFTHIEKMVCVISKTIEIEEELRNMH